MTEKTAESEPTQESGVDLLSEVSSELVPETKTEENPGEPKASELADTKIEEKEKPEPTHKLDPVIQQSVDKRIAKEVRKRKEMEAELEAKEAKIVALESQAKQPGEAKKEVELADMTPAELKQADKEAREYMVWAMNGPMENGHEGTDANGESKFYEPEEIKEIYQHYHRRAMLDIPEAIQVKSQVANQLQRIAEDHPELQNENSIEYKTFKKVWLSDDFKTLRNSGAGAEYAYAIAKGQMTETLKTPNFTPTKPPTIAPRVPVAPAPSRARPTGQTTTKELTEQDFERAGMGQIDDVVAKLLS